MTAIQELWSATWIFFYKKELANLNFNPLLEKICPTNSWVKKKRMRHENEKFAIQKKIGPRSKKKGGNKEKSTTLFGFRKFSI